MTNTCEAIRIDCDAMQRLVERAVAQHRPMLGNPPAFSDAVVE